MDTCFFCYYSSNYSENLLILEGILDYIGGERFKTESVEGIELFEIMRTKQGEEMLSFIKK